MTSIPQSPKFSDLPPEERARVHELIEKMDPKLWSTCYPRIYSEPACGQYYSPKEPARQMVGITLKVREGYLGSSEKYEFMLVSHLARFRVPTYWLSKDIAEAVRKTVPPQELDWYNMPMPFEACCFMIPKGALVHPTEGDIGFIAYARYRAGEMNMSPLIKDFPYGSINGGMTFMALTMDGGSLIHWNMPLDAYGSHISIPDIEEAVMRYAKNVHESGVTFFQQPEMTPEDNHLSAEVVHYVFSTLLLMNARPDLVTAGQRRKLVTKGGMGRDFWSPNVIGEHYRVRRESVSQGGQHASPRLHWVRGSLREQPYGPGRELRKTIWVEPYLRGMDT
jgi:hypothetical protein